MFCSISNKIVIFDFYVISNEPDGPDQDVKVLWRPDQLMVLMFPIQNFHGGNQITIYIAMDLMKMASLYFQMEIGMTTK